MSYTSFYKNISQPEGEGGLKIVTYYLNALFLHFLTNNIVCVHFDENSSDGFTF